MEFMVGYPIRPAPARRDVRRPRGRVELVWPSSVAASSASASLLDARHIDGPLEDFLAALGDVFVVHRGHDSGNTSYGVRTGTDSWFVKHAEAHEPISHLESAIVFHGAVRHPAIIPLVGWFRTSTGLAIVHEYRDGEILNDPLAPGGRPRQHSDSTYARFRGCPSMRSSG